jgi:uncharacterized protein (TIGR02453 family)
VEFSGFDPSLLQFLEELAADNNRSWFQENKDRYEREVLQPSLAFIRAFAPRLKKISPFFVASDRRVGGSLMRVYRDTRFSKDKTPYKTNVGIQFRHEMGKDVHAPGFYVHLAPDECFLALGVWHPDSTALRQIRTAMADRPDLWKRARDNKKFRDRFEQAGDRLKSPPQGFDPAHPLIEDLKWKDFVAVEQLDEQDLFDAAVVERTAASFSVGRPYMRFLCEALAVPF